MGGDVYEGMWVENKMCGEGTYTYKATGDIYSGNWENDKKSGEGRYEFGEGTFSFPSGLKQAGSYDVVKPAEGEEVEEPAEGEPEKPPNVVWNGKSIVTF